MTNQDYAGLLEAWGIQFSGLEPSIEIEGSPERTAARTVVLDTAGKRWILEAIDEANVERKQEVAGRLQTLCDSGLPRIHPWRKTGTDSFFQRLENRRWMVRPYVEGVELNRDAYLCDLWRMDAMTDFLIALRTHSAGWEMPFFSIAAYAESRMAAWRVRYPERTEKLERSFSALKQNFFLAHDRLPRAFCHGDYHPLNMVWGEDCIHSVIDWEFCGTKPELYDVALLIGCIGFDDPDNLLNESVIRLMNNLRGAGFGAPESWKHLLDLMAVIRYGWMSEWIRRKETEAVEMETVYIDILVDQKEYISRAWKNAG